MPKLLVTSGIPYNNQNSKQCLSSNIQGLKQSNPYFMFVCYFGEAWTSNEVIFHLVHEVDTILKTIYYNKEVNIQLCLSKKSTIHNT